VTREYVARSAARREATRHFATMLTTNSGAGARLTPATGREDSFALRFTTPPSNCNEIRMVKNWSSASLILISRRPMVRGAARGDSPTMGS
jgi:hypothetical protein